MQIPCGSCAGIGKNYNWKLVDMDDTFGTMEKEEIVCAACNGKGWTEYAVFSVEEAKAILKHCGLNTEN